MRNIEEDIKQYLAKPLETIEEHTNEVMKQAKVLRELNYISQEIYENLHLACKYHDYGKINSEFQRRVSSDKKINFNSEREVGHNIISPFFIKKEDFENREDYYKVLYAVLNHHYHVNNMEELEERKDFIKSFLKEYEITNITARTLSNIKTQASWEYEILIGLLNKCDYSGSGKYPVEYKNDFLIKSLNNLNYSWNDLQNYLLNNQDENIIVVANTGMGKTEGGLLWIGDNKGFFILPLRTAINSIYLRIKDQIVKEGIEKKVTLMHSEAFDFFLNYLDNNKFSYEEIKNYFKEGKSFSIPLTIATLDQLFNFIFLYPGYELKYATLSYSKIVLDEIQAYSPDLLSYIVLGLKKIVEVGGKFAILTATLPPFIRDYLEKDLGEIKYEKFIQGKDRHNLKVLDEEINSEFIFDHFKNKGGKTLIICNTVRKSQEIYNSLKEMGISELELLHSKYIKMDRERKEIEILDFGKTENRGNKIWISTSLVEASLDIDFDYLFTELNDLSGLFQRLGRVNRKAKKEEMLLEYNSYVFTKINKKLFINGQSGFIDEGIFNLSKEAISTVDGIISEENKYNLMEKYLTTEKIKNTSFDATFQNYRDYMEAIWKGKFCKKDVDKKFRNIISYKVIPKDVYEENRPVIDKKVKCFNETDGIEKEMAKIEINKYTLQVGIYDLNKTGMFIDLGKEKIDIVDGDYSYELGFKRDKKKNSEEIIDNFL